MNKTSEKKTSEKVNDAMTVTALAIVLVGTAFIIQDTKKAFTRKIKAIKNRKK